LIENGYANAEDIDRALRNDAGLYLSFAGNFRYMDLMGLYAYGKVMGELNPTLSTSASLPSFFDELVQSGHLGMASGDGFFHYTEEEIEAWERIFLRFSGEMEKIIRKYPLAQAKETAAIIA
jgi:3-hydroxybutyryl-CoA dehydrogenase